MTKLLEEAIKKVRELPATDQDEAAAMLFSVASKNGELIELDDETRAAIREGRDQVHREEFVSDTNCPVLDSSWVSHENEITEKQSQRRSPTGVGRRPPPNPARANEPAA